MIFSPFRPARGRAPIPDVLPGEFFVVEMEREEHSYILHVDDESKSTFQLGDDVEQIRSVFTARGYPAQQVNDMLDRAREFGACQYIPNPYEHIEDRVIQLLPRHAQPPPLFPEQTHARPWNNLR